MYTENLVTILILRLTFRGEDIKIHESHAKCMRVDRSGIIPGATGKCVTSVCST